MGYRVGFLKLPIQLAGETNGRAATKVTSLNQQISMSRILQTTWPYLDPKQIDRGLIKRLSMKLAGRMVEDHQRLTGSNLSVIAFLVRTTQDKTEIVRLMRMSGQGGTQQVMSFRQTEGTGLLMPERLAIKVSG